MTQKSDVNQAYIQRGSVDSHTEPRFLVIGEIAKPHGVRGEMRVFLHTELPERFTWLDTVYLGRTNPRPMVVEGVRFHKEWVLLKLEGIDDRSAIDGLRGQWLQVPEDEAIPLAENEYFLYQLEGLAVFTDEGVYLGKLVETLQTKANNVFVVRGEGADVLLPDIPDVIQDIDFDNGRITVHLLPGLLP